MRRLQLRLRRDERGSTLLMALVFLAVFSVWLTALLPFNNTAFRLGTTVESQRKNVYAADAAIEANIKALQPSNGDCSKQLPSFPTFDGQTVTVSCVSGSAGTGPPVNVNNRPGQAILTLGRDSSEGFSKSVGSTDLKVHGGVFSNSKIAASGNIYVEKGNIRARGTCAGISLWPSTTTTTTPAYTSTCNLGTAVDPTGDDPNYTPAVASPPVATPALPACSNTVAMSPGTYHDAVGLTALTSSCSDALVWFQPGVYYFDFTNSGSHQWEVKNQGNGTAKIVAGKPKGWTYTTPNAVVTPAPAIPGGCVTEADVQPPPYPANIGVQFIFGGDSTFKVTSGNVEICAQPSTTVQQIAIYGVRPHVSPEPASPFHEQTGCVTALLSATGCNMISTGPGNNAVLVVQGTVYTPAASLDLSMPNASIAKFFGRGLVARNLQISIPGSQSGNTAIEIPDFSAGTTTGYAFQEALLTASVNGFVRTRTRVHYENTPGLPTVTVVDRSVSQ